MGRKYQEGIKNITETITRKKISGIPQDSYGAWRQMIPQKKAAAKKINPSAKPRIQKNINK